MRALVVLVALAAIARADVRDDLDRAKQLEAKLAYDEALAIVDGAITSGHAATPELFVELHLTAGRLNAGLDRAKAAEDHFAIVLAVAPSTTLPDDTSPKFAVPFTRARTTTTPLVVKVVLTDTEIGVDANDPLVTGVAVDANQSLTSRRIARPRVLGKVRALDRYGNTVWIGDPPQVTKTVPTVTTIRTERPAFIARWSTWAAITGVALASGGIAAWRFKTAQDDFDTKRDQGMTDFSDLQAIEDRGRRWGLAANISFGVAAATSIVSIVLFVRGDKTVVVTTGPGAGAGVAGRF